MSDTETRGHHPYSPSSLSNREACPCFQSRHEQHVRSIIGTIAHRATETREDENELSDEDSILVAECLDFYDRRKQLFDEERIRAINEWAAPRNKAPRPAQIKKLFPPVIENKETYRPVDECRFDDAEGTTAGYFDREIISWDRKHAEIFDWKFGNWAVDSAADNVQGWAYVIGSFRANPTLERIKFWFFQPTLNIKTFADFTRADIPKMLLRIQKIVADARIAKNKLDAGDWSSARPSCPNCNFCARIGECKAVLTFACKVGAKFSPLEIPENITPSRILEPNQTSLALRLAAVLSVWANAFRSVTTNRILQQQADLPPGYTLTSSSRRSIVSADKFKAIALQYLTEKEFIESLSIEFGAIEKVISDKSPRGSKKSTIEAFQQALLEGGAVQKGEPFAFLRAENNSAKEKTQTEPTTQQKGVIQS